jgi:hypothetical protein
MTLKKGICICGHEFEDHLWVDGAIVAERMECEVATCNCYRYEEAEEEESLRNA